MLFKHTAKEYKEKIIELFNVCKEDFPFYTRKFLKIVSKEGASIPFTLNAAQRKLYEDIRKVYEDKKKIRVVICKARQQGISTFVPAYFLHRILHYGGVKAYALTDHSDHSANIMAIFKRFVENLPAYKLPAEKSNSDEMIFSQINSSYSVGTARSDNVGRSSTVQLFHGSEVAFWPKSEDHMAGITQSVPFSEGTAIILESTANGTGNVFHRLCMEGMDPKSEWHTHFIPWYIQEEYHVPTVEQLVLDSEEEDLVRRYKLNDAQLNWRRIKIREVGDIRKFRQEYPCTLEEAFLQDTGSSFITSVEIEKANTEANPIPVDKNAPKIIGIDVAWRGKDDSAYCIRSGRTVTKCEEFPKSDDAMFLVSAIGNLINYQQPDRVFIDVGGPGGPIYDRLREKGYSMVHAVNFGERPDDPELYANKRAEMYDRMKRWFNHPPCQIPDSNALKMELALTQWPKNQTSQKLLLAPKADLSKSPNLADAFALTFASNVPSNLMVSQGPILTSKIDWNPYVSEW